MADHHLKKKNVKSRSLAKTHTLRDDRPDLFFLSTQRNEPLYMKRYHFLILTHSSTFILGYYVTLFHSHTRDEDF